MCVLLRKPVVPEGPALKEMVVVVAVGWRGKAGENDIIGNAG